MTVDKDKYTLLCFLCARWVSITPRWAARRTHLDVLPCLRTQAAAVHVDADSRPRVAVFRLQFVQQRDGCLLALHAVEADVAPQLHGEIDLRFQDRELMLQRYGKWGKLTGFVVLHIGRRAGWGVRDAACAIQPDFTDHSVWESSKVIAHFSYNVGEESWLRQKGQEFFERF